MKRESTHKYLYVECVFHQAGVGSPSNPEQVVIALEPEAASVYCRERKMRDFVSESGSNEASVSDTIAHTDVKYVVVDIGGKYLKQSRRMFKRNRFKRKCRLSEYFLNRDCPMGRFDKNDIRGSGISTPF